MAAKEEEDTAASSPKIANENWIERQKRAFTGWCNWQLSKIEDETTVYKVDDLQTQFGDGITLIKLMEVLAYKNKSKLK